MVNWAFKTFELTQNSEMPMMQKPEKEINYLLYVPIQWLSEVESTSKERKESPDAERPVTIRIIMPQTWSEDFKGGLAGKGGGGGVPIFHILWANLRLGEKEGTEAPEVLSLPFNEDAIVLGEV